MSCGDFERSISRSIDGRTSAREDREPFRAHLDGCASCRALADTAARAHMLLAAFPRVEPAADLGDRAFRAAMAAADRPRETTLFALFSFARPAVGLAAALAAGLAVAAWLAPARAVEKDAPSDVMTQLSELAVVDARAALDRTFGAAEER